MSRCTYNNEIKTSLKGYLSSYIKYFRLVVRVPWRHDIQFEWFCRYTFISGCDDWRSRSQCNGERKPSSEGTRKRPTSGPPSVMDGSGEENDRSGKLDWVPAHRDLGRFTHISLLEDESQLIVLILIESFNTFNQFTIREVALRSFHLNHTRHQFSLLRV